MLAGESKAVRNANFSFERDGIPLIRDDADFGLFVAGRQWRIES